MNNTIAILGAGPAGLGAAWQLQLQGKARAVVLEQRDDVGGNSGGFQLAGIPVDYGSHRLHPSCDPRIMADLRRLLGDDLLDRPRHGRIRLRGKWIHFPLKPVDLALRLPWSFGFGVAGDALTKPFARNGHVTQESFATVLERGLGKTICRDFYFPYAVKMWGMPPEALSAIQAQKRVSAGSLGRMVGKVLALVPGLKKKGAGRFFYPRGGFGQINRVIAEAARKEGADVRLETSVTKVTLGTPHRVHVQSAAGADVVEANHVWSTIPISVLAQLIDPPAPPDVLAAARNTKSRAMILIYLILETPQFTPFDAHYFPEAHIRLTRLSEPKNYSDRTEPRDRTVLCGELPCSLQDDVWTATDEQLRDVMRDALDKSGLPVTAKILQTVVKRLPHAYPIYPTGYERHFELVDRWVAQLDGILSFGRQGLFAHDNTHHALAMAYAAVGCLNPDGSFDRTRWAACREEFSRHVVED